MNECIICFEKLETDTFPLNCLHVYHLKCIERWISKGSRTCPICRAPVDEFDKLSLDDDSDDDSVLNISFLPPPSQHVYNIYGRIIAELEETNWLGLGFTTSANPLMNW
ncbi:hypothetical protein AVEN_266871-1 [Araneus ventricosus]|uniref:RING-type domain-containing protein n=1 Tax=Araneus ventricosus TaxID=182803 RepID=A0A4Y2SUY9_ARAVE|nr:hypothetical protein AVEN_266871-1 [Araneus ventricosus]